VRAPRTVGYTESVSHRSPLGAAVVLSLALAPAAAFGGDAQSRLAYPPARKAAVVDDYNGVKVADPYRWLENADDPETVAWVDRQNALTRSLLDRPERETIKKRLTELFNYPRLSVPTRRGDRYFYSRNTGLQNQSVLFVREGNAPERVLLDPNTLSPDGTVALHSTMTTRDGSLLAYTLSRSGSDREEIYVRDVATGKDLPDKLLWAKFTSLTWTPDKSGLYYQRFPIPGSVPPSDVNYFGKVYFHRLGEPQEMDTLILERPAEREVTLGTDITRDGRFLVITAFKGSTDKTEIYVLDRNAAGGAPALLPFTRGFGDAWKFAGEDGGRFFFQTDRDAPLNRVIAVPAGQGDATPVEVVPQGTDKLAFAALVGHRLVLDRLKNASDRLYIHGLDGRLEGEVALPTLGSIVELTGEPDDEEMFLGFASFTFPATPYRYSFKEGTLVEFEKIKGTVDSAAYEVEQVWAPSKDGTRVSMFLVHKRGLPRDGQRPTLLTGYGGFNIDMTPSYSSARFVWLERGGIVAVANLRGGGEYGEAWHQAGILEKKQNVFDDFIGAAEWLIRSGYTSRERLAVQGASNGGLLVGAVMAQRPDLVGAVVCQVPVADMLRYHLFTVGRYWIPEYGSAEDPAQFPFLYRYSPYHNVKDGIAYPATLVTTADTDDRVAPGLAKKFAARLQEAAAGPKPILIRVETKAGHGAGKPISKQIDEQADIYTFLFWQLGVTPERTRNGNPLD
jgi:prolyl oligopeptidase